jgi:hypothetical protein
MHNGVQDGSAPYTLQLLAKLRTPQVCISHGHLRMSKSQPSLKAWLWGGDVGDLPNQTDSRLGGEGPLRTTLCEPNLGKNSPPSALRKRDAWIGEQMSSPNLVRRERSLMSLPYSPTPGCDLGIHTPK